MRLLGPTALVVAVLSAGLVAASHEQQKPYAAGAGGPVSWLASCRNVVNAGAACFTVPEGAAFASGVLWDATLGTVAHRWHVLDATMGVLQEGDACGGVPNPLPPGGRYLLVDLGLAETLAVPGCHVPATSGMAIVAFYGP